MTIKSPYRKLTRAPDLPSYLPSVPPFDGEETFDAAKVGQAFLQRMATAVHDRDWHGFGDLFDERCFWKDGLTLTFDKRTLDGKEAIVEAWRKTAETRNPIIYTDNKDYGLKVPLALNRLGPVLATLDVPFCFSTEGPKSDCIGLAKLIPQEDGSWKIWILTTLFVSLTEHPFQQLPRQSASLVPESQRGQSKAQGLPEVAPDAIFDAVVVGASTLGVSCAINLDAAGANVIAFDAEEEAGGNWAGPGKAYVTLHHRADIMTLPQYPLPEDTPVDLGGKNITTYISKAVQALRVPVFCGIKVVSNVYDDETQLWGVCVEDVKTKKRAAVKARNLVICTGMVASPANPRFPKMTGRDHFRGIVQHACEYSNAALYQNKDVVIVGAANSAHDIARSLADGGAKDVTILQRGPTAFFEWEKVQPLIEGPYAYGLDLATSDFLYSSLPLGVGQVMAKFGMAAIESMQSEFYAKLESKGYSIQRDRDFVTEALESRNGSFFMDRQKSLELVFNDRIKVARGEATGYNEDGIVVKNPQTGEEKVVHAEGVVLATGFEDIDMTQQWIDSGFLKSKYAPLLENPCTLEIDQEGEYAGFFTDSGHPHLYLATTNVLSNRWISTLIAGQIVADIRGKFPARLGRSPPS